MVTQLLETLESITQRPYSSEDELIETVMRNLRIFSSKCSAFVAWRETPIGSGKVDIVLALTIAESLAERIKTAPISEADRNMQALVLSQLHLKKALSIKTISARTGISINILTEVLYNLVELRLCTHGDSTTFVLTKHARSFTNIVTVEGKLTNWRSALRQAYRNRLFSNRAYVVLDARYSRPALQNRHLFASAGVGLALAFAETDSILVVLKPTNERPISHIYHMIAHEALTSSIRNNAYHSKELDNVFYHN